MRIAVPVTDDQFCPHFGRCTGVYLAEVDPEARRIDRPRTLESRRSGCDSLPGWLSELAVDVVLAGGIGAGAQAGLADRGIRVVAGFEGPSPDDVVRAWFDHPEGGQANPCGDHDHQHHRHHCRH
jgi:predicted Fe-Mo cluster-binding NifX family protein